MTALCLGTRSTMCLLTSLLFVGRSLACDKIDCGMGYCIPQDAGGYKCICVDGYDGEYCERATLQRRFVANDTDTSTCDPSLCENGGSCVAEFYYEGEAPMDGSVIHCDHCYRCACPPAFTGADCSDKIGIYITSIIMHIIL